MDKREQRALALAARRALAEAERAAKSEALCRRLLALPELDRADLILSYMAVRDEADLSLLHGALLAGGKTLAFPVCGELGRMEAYIPHGPLRPGRFGIPEPDPAHSRRVSPEEIDLVLVPAVAFDGACGRLGQGGGYYDRYLLRCRGALRVAAAFEAQRLERVVREEHDLLMDRIVTEEKTYTK